MARTKVVIKHEDSESPGGGEFELPRVPDKGENHFLVPTNAVVSGHGSWMQGNFFKVQSVEFPEGKLPVVILEEIVKEK